MTTDNAYTVEGMTCGHCVSSVTEEVSKIPGIIDIAVDLEKGRLRLTSEQPVAESRVKEAVVAAGYALTAARS